MIPTVIAGVLIAVGLMAVTALSFLVAYILGFGLITFLTYGGWAGMLVWRHTTQHTSFWIAQIAGTAVIVAALWLL